jgi:hypothetical protein
MKTRHRTTIAVAVALLSSTAFLRAQNAVDPSGHWEGTLKVPNRDVTIQIDLARRDGATRATFTGVNIKGYPLSDVVLDGASVHFLLQVDGGGVFNGTIGDDGKLAGEFTTTEGSYALPVTLSRTGDATFEPASKSPAIGKDLEGRWAGTLDVNGTAMHITLNLANQPDGTAAGSLANLDQGGVDIPVSAITQTAANVTIEVKVVSGSYTGALNAAGELAGTWSQGPLTAPLTFQRVASRP